jgi:hypothetical protein
MLHFSGNQVLRGSAPAVDWRCQTFQMNRIRKIGVLLVAFLLLAFILQELNHFCRYGHVAPLGLHADVDVTKGDIGIEGISKLYQARLTNYGPVPARVTACEFISDASEHGTMVAYAVERWDDQLKSWKTLSEDEKSTFCRPYPLGISQAHLFTKLLWPGQSISTNEEATAASGGFQLGDSARFSIFSAEAGDWRTTYPTAAFRLDELPRIAESPARMRH